MNNQKKLLPLSLWPYSLKVLASLYLFLILIGYGVALVKIYDLSHFNLSTVQILYGPESHENLDELIIPQSFKSMLSVTHVHALSQPMMLALAGLILVFSTRSEKTKTIVIVMILGGALMSNVSPWLVRYIHLNFIGLLPFSQILIGLGLVLTSVFSFQELWKKS